MKEFVFKKALQLLSLFKRKLKGTNGRPNKKQVDKGSQIYNRLIKSFLENNNMKMHSSYNERKSVIAERVIRTLRKKTHKYMTSISKNLCVDKL